MTKKDYEILAVAFANAAKNSPIDAPTFSYCIQAVTDALLKDNPSFDVQKFYSYIIKRSIG